MHLGLFMMPLHPPDRPLHEVMAENTEKVILADALGFDEVWVGEHFSATTEPICSPLIFLASLLPRTSRIRLGTGVINLPNHHPAIVASEVALFDHMSGGRLMFGIGPGGLPSDYELFDNVDPKLRGERMLESIDIITRLWTQEPPYEILGRHWTVRIVDSLEAGLGLGRLPRPFQKPHPPIAISAMSPQSGSVKTAAMRGWIPISANFIPEASVASHWRKYLEGSEAVGRKPDGTAWRVARNVVVAATDEEARARAFAPSGSNTYYFRYLWRVQQRNGLAFIMKPSPSVPDKAMTADFMIESMVIHGSPDTVADKILALREQVGPFGTLLMAAMDWSGANEAWERESMARLAEEVMPRIRARLAERAA